MLTHLSIIYVTCRKEPKIEWFFDGLRHQIKQFPNIPVEVTVVDYHLNETKNNYYNSIFISNNCSIQAVEPLPSFCQGPHRITKENYFSATIVRNTGFVYCHKQVNPKDVYVVCIDDLTTLSPCWLENIIIAMENEYAFCGSYRKDKNMVVENGIIISSEAESTDSRLQYVRPGRTSCDGGWLYGCSFGLPLITALKINGFDEICSMIGTEDTQFGIRLKRTGIDLFFDTDILTIESAEHHFTEGNFFKRESFPVMQETYFQNLEKFGITEKPIRHLYQYDMPWFINDLLKYNPQHVMPFKNTYHLFMLRDLVKNNIPITFQDMNYNTDTFFFTGQKFSEL